MELELKRIAKRDDYTIGNLSIDGAYFCDTLEDTDRGIDWGMSSRDIAYRKIKAKTAMPTGEYEVRLTLSPRFERVLPLLMNVKGFEGVRIHPGNRPEDTEGCILVGLNKVKGQVIESRKTFDELYRILADEVRRGKKIYIKIS